MLKGVNLFIKRGFDVAVSSVLLVLVSPFIFLSAVMIMITMPGPVFFLQERVGKQGRMFNIYKLRTMKVDREAERTFDSSKDTERTTFWGRFLRRMKIDELPQLFNVLKGDMSLVGPRPTILMQVKEYTAFEKQRLEMRPGMTGLAQVNGNASLSWEQRIQYDVFYVKNFNIFLDLKILIKTVAVVLKGEKHFMKAMPEEKAMRL